MTRRLYLKALRAVPLLLAWPTLGRAQDGTPSLGQVARAEAEMGKDWLEVRFPALDRSKMGCPDVRIISGGRRGRVYLWRVNANFPDRGQFDNHFMGVYALFSVPDTGVLTPARLDTALATVRLTVDEARGEPPMTAALFTPTQAWARREGDRVRLRIEGRAAVRAFARARTDSVDVGWCQRDSFVAVTRVALRRR